jgi:nucleoid DNA-binding protein
MAEKHSLALTTLVRSDTEQRHMRKVEIVQRMAAELGCTKATADQALEAILAIVKEALRQGDPVILWRFGTFHVWAKRARVGRNPKTGEAAGIPARRVVRFTAGQTFKHVVAQAATPGD